MSDIEAWQVVLEAGHWNCGGWTTDGRDGVLMCACGAVLAEPEKAAAS